MPRSIARNLLLLMNGGGGAAASPLLTSLVSYWKLDEASGARSDSHGSNTLSVNGTGGVGAATAKIGANAAQFTAASGQYLSCADNASLSVGDIDFTFSLWFMLDDLGSQRALVGKYGAGSANTIEYELRILGTNILRFFVANGVSASANVQAATFGAYTTATWYFAVAWHDSVANTINIQINNGTVDSAAYSSGGYDSTFAFNLGATAGIVTHNGRIDEVGFWKRVLTADERTELYNAGNGKTYPFLA